MHTAALLLVDVQPYLPSKQVLLKRLKEQLTGSCADPFRYELMLSKLEKQPLPPKFGHESFAASIDMACRTGKLLCETLNLFLSLVHLFGVRDAQ